jgi:hypothetical protein
VHLDIHENHIESVMLGCLDPLPAVDSNVYAVASSFEHAASQKQIRRVVLHDQDTGLKTEVGGWSRDWHGVSRLTARMRYLLRSIRRRHLRGILVMLIGGKG